MPCSPWHFGFSCAFWVAQQPHRLKSIPGFPIQRSPGAVGSAEGLRCSRYPPLAPPRVSVLMLRMEGGRHQTGPPPSHRMASKAWNHLPGWRVSCGQGAPLIFSCSSLCFRTRAFPVGRMQYPCARPSENNHPAGPGGEPRQKLHIPLPAPSMAAWGAAPSERDGAQREPAHPALLSSSVGL